MPYDENKPLTVTENPAARKETWRMASGADVLVNVDRCLSKRVSNLSSGRVIAITAGLLCLSYRMASDKIIAKKDLKTSGND